MWKYTSSVMDHFTNPRNVGEIEDANGVGEVGSIACGDALRLFLKVDPKNETIVDAKFKTFGCASAIASASALTEIIKGRTLAEVSKLTNDDIAKFLGGLPEQKMHCSVMGREALEAAIAHYRGEKVKIEDHTPVICKCFLVTEKKIKENITEHNLKTVEQVTHFTKAGGGCGGCVPDIKRILEESGKDQIVEKSGGKAGKMTNLQRINLISKAIQDEVIPLLKTDGGNLELIDIEWPYVTIKLLGACHRCPGAMGTIQNLIQETLRKRISKEIVVVEEK